MQRFLITRLLALVMTLLGAATIVFFLLHLIPGDPVLIIIGDYFTEESYEAIQHRLGLDRPLGVQYLTFLWRILHLDLGTSFQNNYGVLANIWEQFPYTAQLAFTALVIAVVIAIPTGVLAAINRNRWQDYSGMLFALVAVSAPEFVLGIILLLALSLTLGWFPSHGVGTPGEMRSLLLHLALPALALGSRAAALLARITRSALLEVLSQDYIRTARAKGVGERVVITRHALRNALIPVVTVLGMDIAYFLGGSVVVETVFSRPGVGRILITSILGRDYPQVQGTILVFITVAVVVNTLVDLVYAWLDPRIRYA